MWRTAFISFLPEADTVTLFSKFYTEIVLTPAKLTALLWRSLLSGEAECKNKVALTLTIILFAYYNIFSYHNKAKSLVFRSEKVIFQ